MEQAAKFPQILATVLVCCASVLSRLRLCLVILLHLLRAPYGFDSAAEAKSWKVGSRARASDLHACMPDA